MKTFLYHGFDGQGTRTRGYIEAHDLKDARERLSRGGVFADRVEAAGEKKAAAGGRSLSRPVRRAEFFRALGTLIRAGIPIESALDLVMEQPAGGVQTNIADIAGIRDRIRDGQGLADAMRDAGIMLGAFEHAVLESGEKTGNMPVVLEQVAEYLDDTVAVNESLKSALMYPAVIVATALVVAVGVLGFLVPQMSGVFEDAGIELPFITKAVSTAGRYFVPVMLPAFLAGAALLTAVLRRKAATPEGKAGIEKILSRLPVIRNGFQLLVTARFARTLSLLLNSGISLIEAFPLAGRATGSAWIAAICEAKTRDIRNGEAFHEALASVPHAGRSLSSWARAGEAAGDLGGLMTHAAAQYRSLWAAYVKRAMTIVEPLLILLVAVFVLIIALAILLPILSFNRQLG